MFKRIATSIMIVISLLSAIIVASVAEIPNWWAVTKPWVVLFFSSIIFTLIINNGDLIRRYSYPVRVCVLAWAYEHNVLKTNLGKQSYVVYTKHNKSYAKLYEVTQCLYDMVMLR